MKVKRNNKFYVQQKDVSNFLEFLRLYKISIPDEILSEINTKTTTEEVNQYDFISLDNQELINFFDSASIISDYDEINSLSEEELRKLIILNVSKSNELSFKIKNVRRYDFKKKLILYNNNELLTSKIQDLISILNEKQGRISLNIPSDGMSLNMENNC